MIVFECNVILKARGAISTSCILSLASFGIELPICFNIKASASSSFQNDLIGGLYQILPIQYTEP